MHHCKVYIINFSPLKSTDFLCRLLSKNVWNVIHFTKTCIDFSSEFTLGKQQRCLGWAISPWTARADGSGW